MHTFSPAIKLQQSRFTPIFNSIGTTTDCLTSRAGLAPFVNFLKGTGIVPQLVTQLHDLRANRKGIPLADVFSQLILFFTEGTHQSLVHFDSLGKDTAWQKLVGAEQACGTAQLKRILAKLTPEHIRKLQPFIERTFLTVLKNDNPEQVVLFLDSSVYDNDGAKLRSGVKPTYKKKMGYHMLNLIWNGIYVNSHFMPGNCSTNHGNLAITMLESAVEKIRGLLGEDIQIVVRMDSGYFDQNIFSWCDEHRVQFVCAGKVYSDHSELAQRMDFDGMVDKENCKWGYCRYTEQRKSWPENMHYRALFMKALEEDGQLLLGLKSRTVITNLTEAEASDSKVIEYDHSRGTDELTHRAAKEFASERMPCLDFESNNFWYLLQIISFNLFQLFKREVAGFKATAYPTTVRRQLFDIAGKIVKSARTYVLKLAEWTMEQLQFQTIWEKSLRPYPLQ